MRGRWKWLVGAVVALVVLVPVGTYVYIHFVEGDAPGRLALQPSGSTGGTPAAAVPAGGIDGTWEPTPASQVGYRVKEVLFGQDAEAVGRTSKVTGTMTVTGSTINTVDLSVDMTSVSSDRSQRDNQFRNRIMDTSSFPTSTFKLTTPIDLGTVPTDATPVTVQATGMLTLRDTTKPVTFNVSAQRNGATINVQGAIPINFSEWKIPSPSIGPVTTQDHGELELLVVFAHKA
jgi:polyisoprenoid-binding protein YceI